MRYFIFLLAAGLPSVGQPPESDAKVQIQEHLEVVFQHEDFRRRTQDVAPVLVYGKEFFMRFEPHSVGDILKRIAGISGDADAGEFDAPAMRGLSPGYTQILINGKPAPGFAPPLTLSLDQIPAHAVERIEIIRSPTASLQRGGSAGTINIVLKSSPLNPGGELRSGLTFPAGDGDSSGILNLHYGWHLPRGEVSLFGGARNPSNPKTQVAQIRDVEEGELTKTETNLLKIEESSIGLHTRFFLKPNQQLTATASYLDHERTENERSSFLSDSTFLFGEYDTGRQRSTHHILDLGYRLTHTRQSITRIEFRQAQFQSRSMAELGEFEADTSSLSALEETSRRSRATHGHLSFEHFVSDKVSYHVGVDFSQTKHLLHEQFIEIESDKREEEEAAERFDALERSAHPFLEWRWSPQARHAFSAGIRLDFIRIEHQDLGISQRNREAYPHMHYRYRPTPNHSFRISLARTSRIPDFEEGFPVTRRDQPREDDLALGNPRLKPEASWGADLGYEFQFPNQEGLIGVNLFHRDIRDLIILEQQSAQVFQFQNQTQGSSYGIELDAGMPLTFFGLPQISLTASVALSQSEYTADSSTRREPFPGHSKSAVNLSYLHVLAKPKITYGFHWLSLGKAYENHLAETAAIDFGDDLEFHLEKSWRNRFSIRFAVKNILDSSRDELLLEFDGARPSGELLRQTQEKEFSERRFLLSLRMRL